MQAPHPTDRVADDQAPTKTATLWHDNGWRARVVKNEEDDGWAVEMHRDGDPEPALIGPWTMGRDKKNPKPLDTAAFNTLVKTAAEIIRRHEQQLHARLHREVRVTAVDGSGFTVSLDIVPSDDDPYAWLTATDPTGTVAARVRVRPEWRLNSESATGWVNSGFGRPAGA